MAIDSAYATAVEYRSVISDTVTTDDVMILRHLTAVSRYLEREAGQFFTKDAAVVARLLRGSGSKCLRLDQEGAPGIATATGLVIEVDEDNDGVFTDETDLVVADLLLLPLNATKGAEPKPFTEVELTSRSRIGSFPSNVLVQVTATWGWPSVPELVWSSTIELAAIWRGESPRSTGRMNELEQVVSASPLALSLVKRFRAAYTRAVVA